MRKKAGDHTYGIIVSCAENHGGRSHSLTAPNPEAQKALLRTAYKDPALARQISYIEAHGTGTKLGDPIEIDALKMAWQEMNLWDTKPSIALGSVKTHIGHLEPAAGMASLLKVLLSLKHKILPTNLHFNKLNPFIDIKNSPFYVINENEPWQSDGPRVAGISSFGFGGSNAHIVVREADKREITLPPPKPFYLVCISAKNKWSLKQLGKNLLDYLSNLKIDDPAYNLANIGYTLHTGRAHFEYRTAWIVATIEDLQSQILKTDFDHIEEVSYKGRSNGILPPWTEQTEYLLQLTQWQLLYLQGHELNWDVLHTAEPKLKLNLPTYPFHTKPYWFEHKIEQNLLNTKPQRNIEYIDYMNNLNLEIVDQATARVTIPATHVWLSEHIVNGYKMLPGVAHLSIIWSIISKVFPNQKFIGFSNINWLKPIICPTIKVTFLIKIRQEHTSVHYEIINIEQTEIFSTGTVCSELSTSFKPPTY